MEYVQSFYRKTLSLIPVYGAVHLAVVNVGMPGGGGDGGGKGRGCAV